MEKVNALKVRNRFGEILDRLERTGEPIQVSKQGRVRAVLITPEDYECAERVTTWHMGHKEDVVVPFPGGKLVQMRQDSGCLQNSLNTLPKLSPTTCSFHSNSQPNGVSTTS